MSGIALTEQQFKQISGGVMLFGKRVSDGLISPVAVDDSGNMIGAVSVAGFTARFSANFNRPNDTTAYASGDLVANSTTAGSVVPLSLTIDRLSGKGGMVRRAKLMTSNTSLTNASFRLHVYSASPTPSNGDNGAWLTDHSANYLGAIDVTVDKAFTDGAVGVGVPNAGSEINDVADTVYVLIEARAAYTPTANETFTVELEVLQN